MIVVKRTELRQVVIAVGVGDNQWGGQVSILAQRLGERRPRMLENVRFRPKSDTGKTTRRSRTRSRAGFVGPRT